MSTERSSRSGTRAKGWRIVARRLNEFGDVVFDVYHGPHRRAWGLKDEATARRWVTRLAASSVPATVEADTPDSDQETGDSTGSTPRRVWWNEA